MTPGNAVTDDALWNFAVRSYAAPGVASACLRAQDRCGVDVCLLLFALWMAREGCHLDATTLRGLDAQCMEWRRGVVEVLRRQRRAWQGLGERDEDYAGISELELAAERLQLLRLQQLAAELAPGRGEITPFAALQLNLGTLADLFDVDADTRQALFTGFAPLPDFAAPSG